MPEMMKLMPDMMQKIKAADDRFPKPRHSPRTTKQAKQVARLDKVGGQPYRRADASQGAA